VGSITEGKRADIILLDGLAHLSGAGVVAGAVVTCTSPADVRTVLVDGQIVKHNGRLVNHDLSALRSVATQLARRILN
jgi:5-methylthioadenosine/S-adenosylhomocysteine deaminase